MTTTLETVTSADGTKIALERHGDGPPVVLVGGAFNDRTTVAALAAALAPTHTAVAYDRRGRGDSGDNRLSNGGGGGTGGSAEDAVARETEDLTAVIGHVGGSAHVFGHSSGAILALEAAERGVAIDKLAVYEAPYIPDGTRPRPAADLFDRITALVGEGRREDAATLFLVEGTATPAEVVESMRGSETWAWLTRLAHSLPYDVAACGPGNVLPAGRLATIRQPTLAMAGGNGWDWIRDAARAVADAVPGARHAILDGQDHGSVLAQPEAALLPALRDFLT